MRARRPRRKTPRDESPDELAQLESLYDCGRYAEAIALGEAMLAAPASDHLRARTRLQVAWAHLQLGRPDLGKDPLGQARAYFEAAGDAEMLVECKGAEASVALLEQRADAVELATSALVTCRSLTPVPNALEVRLLNAMATAQWLLGERERAIAAFEEAIGRADPVLDLRRLGKLLDSAGIAYSELGHVAKSIEYGSRAVALFDTLQDLVSLARAENNLGWALMSSGDLPAARRHLERSLQLFDRTGMLRSRSAVLCSLGELALAEGNLELASSYADAAIESGTTQSESWFVAEARTLKGRIAVTLGDIEAVDREFQSALAILEASGMTSRLIECHAAYAETLEDRGDLRRAYQHLKAAVSITEPAPLQWRPAARPSPAQSRG